MNLFLKKMLYFLPIPILILSVNLMTEKINILQIVANQAANYIISGYNVANAYTLGDYLIKEAYAKNCTSQKDIIVFGSSRSLGISENLFSDKSFFNMSNTDSRLENFVYFYLLWREQGLTPSKVILGLDDWLLKTKTQPRLWKIIKERLIKINPDFTINIDYETEKEILCENLIETTQRLSSITLFRNNLQLITNLALHKVGFKGFNFFYQTKENFANTEVMMHDGSINYGLVRRSRSTQEINKLIDESFKKNGFPKLKYFIKLDQDLIKLFEIFVQLLKQDNVKITFFLTPYHPEAYKLLKSTDEFKIVCTTSNYFIHFAKQNNIDVLGGYDPGINNLTDADFFDEFHPKASAMEKVFGHQ